MAMGWLKGLVAPAAFPDNARTLLTMLEEGKIVTREQFDATKQRLDMLDGKLDNR